MPMTVVSDLYKGDFIFQPVYNLLKAVILPLFIREIFLTARIQNPVPGI